MTDGLQTEVCKFMSCSIMDVPGEPSEHHSQVRPIYVFRILYMNVSDVSKTTGIYLRNYVTDVPPSGI